MAYKYFVPAIGWGLLILIAISMPPDKVPDLKLLTIPNIDKLVHVGLFFVFAFLTCFGFFMQNDAGIMHKRFELLSFLVSLIFSLSTEVFQHLFIALRTASILDFLANLLGTVFGIIVFGIVLRIKSKKN